MPTQLYLIRHGIAVERDEFSGPDSERYLTSKGEQKTRKVAERLYELGLGFAPLYTSPFVRARQTATLLIEGGVAAETEVMEFLAPAGSFGEGLTCLQTFQQVTTKAIAFVGHEPDLSQWAELLLWGEARGVITLKKAGIIGLSLPETIGADLVGNCQLFWLTAPSLLLEKR